MAERSKARVYGRSLAAIAGFESSQGHRYISCVIRLRSLRRANHSSRGVRQIAMCRVCDLETSIIRRPWYSLGCCGRKNKIYFKRNFSTTKHKLNLHGCFFSSLFYDRQYKHSKVYRMIVTVLHTSYLLYKKRPKYVQANGKYNE